MCTYTLMKSLTRTLLCMQVCRTTLPPSIMPITLDCTQLRSLILTNIMVLVNPAGTSASVTPQSLNNGYSGHVQTSSHYAPGLPASWVTPGMTHTIILSAPVVHVTPSSSPPAPSSAQATTNGPRRTQKEENLIQLEQDIISSAWYAANDLEPACGDLDCPYHADAYGIRGMSCYTAFVDTKPDGTFGCWREQCSSYSRRKLDDAVKHQRTNHFNHKPFVCTPTNGTTW